MEAAEQSVIVRYTLEDGAFGSEAEREAIHELEDELIAAIESNGVGELDGHEFGGGQAVLYAYGPDADRLYAVMETSLRRIPIRPAHVVLRFGGVEDPAASENRIDL